MFVLNYQIVSIPKWVFEHSK